MASQLRGFPEFQSPPVNETVFSLQLAPLARFVIPHFGLYWQRIRSSFPHINVVPPVAPATEQYSPPAMPVLDVQLLQQPEVRCWYLNPSGTHLIQLQRDRFSFNWRQVEGVEAYPRFPPLFEAFRAHWASFKEFAASENLGEIAINQCEVTYVNHIAYGDGEGWRDYSELCRVLAPWSGKMTDGFLPAPERVRIESVYRLPSEQGRLHISAVPVIRGRDGREIMQVTLTARGAPASVSEAAAFAWIELGREWVVKGFADLTSREIQSRWGRVR
jgi:uncharacterized protein (TIGR04255 family)